MLLTEHRFELRLHRLLWVYTCQSATLLEITCRCSIPHGIQKELPFKGPSAFKIACRIMLFSLYSKLLNFLLTVPRRYFFICVLPCMCFAALWSSVGKGAKAVVAGPAGAAFAGPTFLAEYAFHRDFISFRFFFLWAYLWFHLIMRQFTETLRGGGGFLDGFLRRTTLKYTATALSLSWPSRGLYLWRFLVLPSLSHEVFWVRY